MMQPTPSSPRRRLAAVLVAGARVMTWVVVGTVAWISLLPGSAMMPIGRGFTEHFAAYLAIGAVAALAYGGSRVRYGGVALVAMGCAGLFEWAQLWTPGRTFSYVDVAASGVGVLAGVACALAIRSVAGLDRPAT